MILAFDGVIAAFWSIHVIFLPHDMYDILENKDQSLFPSPTHFSFCGYCGVKRWLEHGP
jgi:hypothetical protein